MTPREFELLQAARLLVDAYQKDVSPPFGFFRLRDAVNQYDQSLAEDLITRIDIPALDLPALLRRQAE